MWVAKFVHDGIVDDFQLRQNFPYFYVFGISSYLERLKL